MRSDAPGQTGARITLADGSVACFSADGTGTLEIRSPADRVTFTGPLPMDVQPPPLGGAADAGRPRRLSRVDL